MIKCISQAILLQLRRIGLAVPGKEETKVRGGPRKKRMALWLGLS